MATIDYKEKYEQALERAVKLRDDLLKNGTLATAKGIESIFPELAESEDERIRKALVEMIHDTTGDELWVDYNVHKEDALAWLEKQGEKKPVDKVEPKFKVGDWVIDRRGITDQITDVIENVTNHTYGYDTLNGEYFNDYTEDVRLWTIKEAKAGDILAAENGWTCIFREIRDFDFASYCFMDASCCFFPKGGKCHALDLNFGEKMYPATKEQRDLLFQKMHEAGYEWDAEKKELKKVEQKPVPKFKKGDIMRTLKEAADGMTDGMPVIVSIDDEYYHCTNELIAIKDQDDYEYPPMGKKKRGTNETFKRRIS